jgi:hypothetical protein
LKLYILSHKTTSRLLFVANILNKHWGIDVDVTTDVEEIPQSSPWINYSDNTFGRIHITPNELLFQKNITKQEIVVESWESVPCFFKTGDEDIPFDLFSAIFYMLSRYEEYLPHKHDIHGRFPASQSLAHNEGFLEIPVVDIWIKKLKELIEDAFQIELNQGQYQFISTVDIDSFFAFLHKGFVKNIVGYFKHLFEGHHLMNKKRMQTLREKINDPFDTTEEILAINKKSPPIFFVQVGGKSKYDKQIRCSKRVIKDKITGLSERAKVGLHPSYDTSNNLALLAKEKSRLERIVGEKITISRQHYLRLSIPTTYRMLDRVGITDDYSLGFADAVGFRAGTSIPFCFYDLQKEKKTDLTIHPLAAMDTTLFRKKGVSQKQIAILIAKMVQNVKSVGGDFVLLWHNSSLYPLESKNTLQQIYSDIVTKNR